jgi:hypothetical protein
MNGDSTRDVEEWLTRTQVAERLGISPSSVRRLEWDQLHPEVDERGVHRFDPAEVAALRLPRRRAPAKARRAVDPEARDRARRGRLAAEVFVMFGRRVPLAQIVVATRQPPDAIRALYREWSTSLEEAELHRRSLSRAF